MGFAPMCAQTLGIYGLSVHSIIFLCYQYYRLNVRGLGEHVEGMQAVQAIASRAELFQVAGERAGVAGDIDDFTRV